MGVNADSPWKEAKLFVNNMEIAWGEPIALFRGEESEVRVEVPASIAGALSLGLVNDDELTVGADPAFNDWVPGSDGKFTWKLTPDAGRSGRVQLVVLSRELDEFWTLPCRVISSSLGDEVEVWVSDYSHPTAPDIFFRAEPRTVNLTYKPGSPLAGYPLELTGKILTGNPTLRVNRLEARTWLVNALDDSGTFRLELKGAGFTQGITLPDYKVLSRNLADEVDKVRVDGVDFPSDGIVLFRDVPKRVTVTFKPGSPLVISQIQLGGTVITGLLPTDLLVIPLVNPRAWRVVAASTRSGTFKITLTAAGMSALDLPVSKVLSGDLREEADVLIGGIPVPSGGVRFITNTPYVVTLRPKPGSPLTGYPVKLRVTLRTGHATFTSDPEFDQAQSEHRWTVTGTHVLPPFATFNLIFAGDSMFQDLWSPACSVFAF